MTISNVDRSINEQSQRSEEAQKVEGAASSVWPKGQSFWRQHCSRLELDKQQGSSSTDERISLSSLKSPEAVRPNAFLEDFRVLSRDFVALVNHPQLESERPEQIEVIRELLTQSCKKYYYYSDFHAINVAC